MILDRFAVTATLVVLLAVVVLDEVDAFGARLEPSSTTATSSTARRRRRREGTDADVFHGTTLRHHHRHQSSINSMRLAAAHSNSNHNNENNDGGEKYEEQQLQAEYSFRIDTTTATTATTFSSSPLFGPEGSFVFFQDEAEKLATETFSIPSSTISTAPCDDSILEVVDVDGENDEEECEIPSEWRISIATNHVAARAKSKSKATTPFSLSFSDDDNSDNIDMDIEREVFSFLGIKRAEPIIVPIKATPQMRVLHEDGGDWQ